jgi:hypothetical protein
MSQALFSVPASNQFVACLALHDARVFSDELKIAQGEDWRRRWISTVTALRCVGHVLDKVDGQRDHKARDVINKWWKQTKESKPEPAIFWGFIESERNTALKAYSSSVRVEINHNMNKAQELDCRQGDPRLQ